MLKCRTKCFKGARPLWPPLKATPGGQSLGGILRSRPRYVARELGFCVERQQRCGCGSRRGPAKRRWRTGAQNDVRFTHLGRRCLVDDTVCANAAYPAPSVPCVSQLFTGVDQPSSPGTFAVYADTNRPSRGCTVMCGRYADVVGPIRAGAMENRRGERQKKTNRYRSINLVVTDGIGTQWPWVVVMAMGGGWGRLTAGPSRTPPPQ